jgi:hypothetical protein
MKWRYPAAIGLLLTAQLISTGQQPSSTSTSGAAPVLQDPAKASITGIVLKAGAGEPVRSATVTLRPVSGAVNSGPGNNGQPPQAAFPNQGGQRGGQQQGGRGDQQGQRGAGGQGGQGGQGGGPQNQVKTGETGSFEFLNVNPGQYQVAVDHEGFISQEYGQRTWNGRGTPITVVAGQKITSLTVQLVPTGTIAGKIVDERGDPMVRVQVQALTYQYQNGIRTLVTSQQERTNDQGEYRLYWLNPGDYYVTATPDAGGFGPGPGGRGGPPQPVAAATTSDEVYAATYYPGGTDPETAVSVRLPAAQEVRGVNFILRPVHTVKVSGKITVPPTTATTQQTAAQQAAQNAQAQGGRGGRGGGRGGPGGPGGPGGGMQILFTRIGASTGGRGGPGGGRGGPGGGGPGGGRGGPGPGQVPVFVDPDGTFQIQNVVPGSYNLTAIQPAQDKFLSARTRVEVGYGNVENINLTLNPGIDISGKIAVDDSKTPQQFQMNRVRVQLTPSEDLPVGNVQAQVQDDGTFVLNNVAAMNYRITVNGLSNGYVISGRYGNSDAFNDLLQVETDRANPLVVQVGFSPGSVSGTVEDSHGQPFQAATCVLVPASRGRVDLYKTVSSDQTGRFNFANVAPGDYKLVAWEDVPSGAYLDPAFFKQYEGQATSITIARGSPSATQLKVIPAATP